MRSNNKLIQIIEEPRETEKENSSRRISRGNEVIPAIAGRFLKRAERRGAGESIAAGL